MEKEEKIKKIFDWISQFVNFEKNRGEKKEFTLDRMKILAAMSGNPEKNAPVIHIAGSKGKGSVTALIAHILEEYGLKTARYMSPHLLDFRERITQGSHFFDEDIYISAGNELRSITENFISSQKNYSEPTFFELMTLYFFLCARKAGCSALVIETGLGGRLDATNIVDPLISVITLIEKEHTEYLGNTLELIAGEKAGIIKPLRPLALAAQKKEALDIILKKACENKSSVYYFPDEAEIINIKITEQGTFFDLIFKNRENREKIEKIVVPMAGAVQTENAGLAILTVKKSFPNISDHIIRKGIEKCVLPARFEKISDDPVFIIDGAHTEISTLSCVETFISLYGEDGILLFGCAADKNVSAMADILGGHFSKIIITTPGTFKMSFPENIFAVFKEKYPDKTLFIPQTTTAIEKASALAKEKRLPVLATGSFYLAGEIKVFAATKLSQS